MAQTETTAPDAMASAPRDGTWIEVRSSESGEWFPMYWNPEGTSWNESYTDLVRTGIWTDDDGWLQPNEVNAWRPRK